MVLGKKVAILGWEWGRNSALREGQKIPCIFTLISLSISLNICFGCSNKPSHHKGSFEYPQHMLRSRNKKNNF